METDVLGLCCKRKCEVFCGLGQSKQQMHVEGLYILDPSSVFALGITLSLIAASSD